MKKQILEIAILSTTLLSACSIDFLSNQKEEGKDKEKEEKINKKDNNQSNETSKNENNQEQSNSQEHATNEQTTENHNNTQNQDNSNKQNDKQISEEEAIQKAKEVFSSSSYHDFKIDRNRSTYAQYSITFLLNDATGTPQSSATTVSKVTGEVGPYIDDRTDEEKANYNQYIKESPKYKGSTEKLEELSKKDRTRPNDEVIKQNDNNTEENNQNQTDENSTESNQEDNKTTE
ncbi:hypothetical protein ACY2C7_12300 [Staphylococcus cohnii]